MTTRTQSRRRLHRPHDRLVAGVAAGIADHLSISATSVRIGFVALTLLGGAGVPLYLAGWLLLPSAGEQHAPAMQLMSRTSTPAKQAVAIAAGFLVLAGVVGYSPLILLMAVALGFVSYRLLGA